MNHLAKIVRADKSEIEYRCDQCGFTLQTGTKGSKILQSGDPKVSHEFEQYTASIEEVADAMYEATGNKEDYANVLREGFKGFGVSFSFKPKRE